MGSTVEWRRGRMEATNPKQLPHSGKKKSMHTDQLVFLHAVYTESKISITYKEIGATKCFSQFSFPIKNDCFAEI